MENHRQQERNEKYDFYKGLLMLGVVYGHVLNAFKSGSGGSVWIHSFIRTYDMPMFAFISGIFLKQSCQKRKAFDNFIIKLETILLPAMIWNYIFCLIGGHYKPAFGGGLWFLYSLFISSVIIIVADKTKNEFCKIIVLLMIVFCFHTIIIDPFKTGFLLPPTVVGYYYNEIESILKKASHKSLLCYLIAGFYLILQSFWMSDYNVWNLGCDVFNDKNTAFFNIVFNIYRFLIGIVGCFVMKRVFDYLYLLSNSEYKESVGLIKHLIICGQKTMEIYILHAWFVSTAGSKAISIIVDKLGYNPFWENKQLLLLVIAPSITIITLYLMYLLSCLINKIPYIGKYAFKIRIIKVVDKKHDN